MPRCKRLTLPGYPKDFVFETRADLDQYLSGDRVTCLLCGRTYALLDTHLRAQHSMTSDDYRARYGIPGNRGLCGSERTERDRKRMLALFEADPDERKKRAEYARAHQHLARATKPTKMKPKYWKNERTKYTQEMWREVGARIIAGEGVTIASRAVGVEYTTLRAALKRWPDLKKWWESEVEPRRVNKMGHNLTAAARAARSGPPAWTRNPIT